MIIAARILSWIALAGTIVPSVLFFDGRATLDQTKLWMFVATVIWFATAPVWMERQRPERGGGA
jgi:hypothetical protein